MTLCCNGMLIDVLPDTHVSNLLYAVVLGICSAAATERWFGSFEQADAHASGVRHPDKDKAVFSSSEVGAPRQQMQFVETSSLHDKTASFL